MQVIRLGAATLCTLIVAAACVDAPTEPAATPGSTRTGANIILDPVIVIGDPNECDPYQDLNWCGGDGDGGGTCMTSSGDPAHRQQGLTPPKGGKPGETISTTGCTGGGGGGGGGGGRGRGYR